jgi:DNA-binding IclR family transcriptional regulator
MKSATTVTKVCRIIDELTRRQPVGISELSRRTALLPSDVHRIVTSLRVSGYVDQISETKKYQIGIRLLCVGLEACQQNHLYERARPELVRLSWQIDATVHLAAFDRGRMQVFLIDEVSGGEGRSRGHLGGPEPLHCSALGKVVVAGLDSPAAAHALEKSGMARGTVRTMTDLAALAGHLRQVQSQGYAVDREECFDGLCCLGCPVRDSAGKIIGSISTSMATPQFLARNEPVLAAELKAAANRISVALGKLGQLPEEIYRLRQDWRRRIRTDVA